MNNKLTTFADIPTGTKFILGGEDRTVYVKLSPTQAKREGNIAAQRARHRVSFKADTPVLTEYGATVNDILNSWSRLEVK